MTALTALLGIIFTILFFASIRRNRSVVDSVIFGITGWIFTYITVSAVLLIPDYFSVLRTSCISSIIWVAIFITFYFRGYRISFDFNIKSYIIPIIAGLAILPFVLYTPHEYFAMGQDEGVYQTEAIMYIRGKVSKEIDLVELDTTEDESLRTAILDHTGGPTILGTYDYYSSNWQTSIFGVTPEDITPHSVTFHGLHTISALMGLWGSIFGISNMNSVNCLLLVWAVFWIFLICSRLKLGNIGKISSLLITAMSPIIIWVSKSALTEIGTTLIWLVFIYLLLGRSRKEIYLSALMPGIYGLYHLSSYVFVPLFVFLYIALWLYTGNKDYMKGMVVSVLGFYLSFVTAIINACGYTLLNYRWLYKGPVNANNIFYIVTAICTILIFVGVLLSNRSVKINYSSRILRIMIRIIVTLSVLFFIYRLCTGAPGIRDISYLTIVSMALMAGVVIPIVIFASITIFTDKWTDSNEHLIMLSFFIYCILLYSIVMMPQINYYYYYARYIAMYIPMIAILGGICLDRMKNKIAVPLIIITAAFLLPPSLFLLKNKDDTRVQWDTLEELEELTEFDNVDAVFLRRELYSLLYYEFRSLDIDVYPITDDFFSNANELSEKYESIMVLDYTFDERFEDNYPIVRRIFNLDTQDLGNHKIRFLKLPNGIDYNSQTITVYRYE